MGLERGWEGRWLLRLEIRYLEFDEKTTGII